MFRNMSRNQRISLFAESCISFKNHSLLLCQINVQHLIAKGRKALLLLFFISHSSVLLNLLQSDHVCSLQLTSKLIYVWVKNKLKFWFQDSLIYEICNKNKD